MNKDKLEIDKNKLSFENRKNVNLALNRDGCALVDTKWLIEENFERKEPTIENVMNSDYIYIIDKNYLYQGEPKIIRRCDTRCYNKKVHAGQNFYMGECDTYASCRLFSICDYKKTWAFSPCDLEGSIWIH